MEKQTRDQAVACKWKAIDELDFGRIKAKMLHRQRGESTTPEAVAQAEQGYRQFLKMAAKYPDMPVVPSEAVDEFWHMHILDTQRYATDCERIFGYMLHHDPYVGIEGPEDEARLFAMAAVSNALAAQEFGSQKEQAAYCALKASEGSPAYCARAISAQSAAYCALKVSEAPAYCALNTSSAYAA
jgi:hypothetical protein